MQIMTGSSLPGAMRCGLQAKTETLEQQSQCNQLATQLALVEGRCAKLAADLEAANDSQSKHPPAELTPATCCCMFVCQSHKPVSHNDSGYFILI